MVTIIANIGSQQEVEVKANSVREFVARQWAGSEFFKERRDSALKLADAVINTRGGLDKIEGMKFTNAYGTETFEVIIVV